MQKLTIELKFRLPVKLLKKRKWYIASCPILDVVTQGDTEKKARDSLIDALTLFLSTSIEMGTLNEVLKQCGFRTSEAPASSTNQEDYINIPIHLLANQLGTKACHA
ncbi:MAG: hypothetical protein FP816_19570 [Desulfobacteraceae bacterium]|nr:hypothetical protein [Desulfobacteraceae bacterium]MBU4010103.1 hypothetical protein [Pseudomonadota bacterium]MBU4035454.1 hypothetical protein [Pseudomonadota bacterium]